MTDVQDALLQAVREEVRVLLAPVLTRIEALEGERRKYSTSMRRDDSEIVQLRQRVEAIEKKFKRELDDTRDIKVTPK